MKVVTHIATHARSVLSATSAVRFAPCGEGHTLLIVVVWFRLMATPSANLQSESHAIGVARVVVVRRSRSVDIAKVRGVGRIR